MEKNKALRLCGAILIGLFSLSALPASAALVTWNYSGVVESCPITGIPPCGDVLDVGDFVGGPFTADVDDIIDTKIPFSAFTSFSVMVGDTFAVTSDNSALIDGVASTDEDGEIDNGFLVILAEALPGAPPTRVTLNLGTGGWVAEALLPDPVFIAKGDGGFKLAPIPVPGGLVLLAPVLALMAIRARRR